MQKQQQNEFALKTDTGSAELYFHYYGMLMHQQNMLQDQIRTGTYYAAILENPADFQGKVVMDVGAGSGILSLFAAQVLYPLSHYKKPFAPVYALLAAAACVLRVHLW